MRASLAFLLALSLALAGCFGAVSETETPVDPASLAPEVPSLALLLEGLPCVESPDTAGTTENFLLAKHLLKEDYGGTTHGEMDIVEDIRGVHALQARWQEGGFDVLNLDNPAAPVWVGNLSDPTPKVLDVKVSTDGATALLGHLGMITIVDVRNLSAPKTIGEYRFPAMYNGIQAHMLYFYPIGGIDRVFVASQQNYGVWIFNLVGAPDARALEHVTTYMPLANGPLGPHDIWVGKDPILQKPVLWIANGFAGWLAADVSDPANPKHLGGMVNADPHQSYTHTIQSTVIDGRRLVATIAEVGQDALKIYDATNLLAPVLVGTWVDDLTNPLAMQHNLQIVGDRLYVAHYERGVFVFNLTKMPAALPLLGTLQIDPVGHYGISNNLGQTAVGYLAGGGVGGVWDVVLHRGTMYVSLIDDGLHVVGDGCLATGNPLHTSTG
ncbi:MAG TPA: hypothetical protein VNZ52_09640 [Candidatus Thermoplasmatota archaeon]|nr:hypothetical protein [Candidatus Thermoplasmatota archaeon]